MRRRTFLYGVVASAIGAPIAMRARAGAQDPPTSRLAEGRASRRFLPPS